MATAFHSSVGSSAARDAKAAGQEAAADAARHCSEPRLALVFAGAGYDQEQVLAGVRESLDTVPIFGASSYGEIGVSGYATESVVVMLWSGEFSFVMAGEPYEGSPRKAAFRVATSCNRQLGGRRLDLAMIFCAADRGYGTEVLETVKEVIGDTPVVFGGGSGVRTEGQDVFGPSFQYADGKLVTTGVGLLFLTLESPTLKIATTVSHGLQPISNPMAVTKAKGHYIYEVNGENVFAFYEKYLGRPVEEAGHMLRTYPFLVKAPGHDWTLPRVPVYIEREQGRIGFFPTATMEGQTVSLGHFTRNEIVRACRESAYNAKVALAHCRARAMLAVSCGARQMFLGNRVAEEAECLYDVFGRDVPVAGLYSGAEIAPLGLSTAESADVGHASSSYLVAETFCLLVIGDSAATTRAGAPASGIRRAATGAAPSGEETLQSMEEENGRLKKQIQDSEQLLDLREQVLLKVNKESIDVTSELRAANLRLSEMNQRNMRLQRIIRQYTPRSTWNKAGKQAGEEKLEIPDELADLTYMFLDVKGFTSYSETHSPEEVVRSLNDIFQPVTDILYENTGDVNKFIGDAIFATFFLPEDAVNAGLAICRKMREIQTPFKVRIGIHMGRAVLGNVGSDIRRDNTLIGDAVNLAQRLESNAAPGGIAISREVYTAVSELIELKGSFREVPVKGKSQPVEVFDIDTAPAVS